MHKLNELERRLRTKKTKLLGEKAIMLYEGNMSLAGYIHSEINLLEEVLAEIADVKVTVA